MKSYFERFVLFQFKKRNTTSPIPDRYRSSVNNLKSLKLVNRLIDLLSSVHEKSLEFPLMAHKWLPYQLSILRSGIKDAGFGVHLRGEIDKGSIVALYPGTIYQTGDPLFLSSIRNSYILRCFDGSFVDGKHFGLSESVYKSMHRFHCSCSNEIIADRSWIKSAKNCKRNPLAVGQIINNGNSQIIANVHYQELDLPNDFPIHLRKWIPNVHYSRDWNLDEYTRIILIISNKTIKNEELFSTYYEEVI